MIQQYLSDVVALFKYYRTRCIFSLFGIVVGIGSICALIALNSIVHKNSQEFIKKFGGSRFVLNVMPTTSHDQKAVKEYLDFQSIRQFVRRFDADFTLIPYKLLSTKARLNNKSLDAISMATTHEIFGMMDWQISEGRKLHVLDKSDKVAVIGASVAEKLHALGANEIIGLSVNLDGYFFTIVGVLHEKEFNPILDFDVNHVLLFDLNLLSRFENNAFVDSFIVQGKHDDLVTSKHKLNEQLTSVLGNVRFFFRDALLFEQALFKQVTLTMNILAIVAGVTLLLGIVSILNLLFILIEERKKEIGLRMSIGATPNDIGKQFLVESLSLSLIGGSIGLVFGQIGAFFIVKMLDIDYFWQAQSIVLGFAITIVIGLGVGFIPAKMAARFDPVRLINS